ncbi:MAG: 30S ribosomal protein S2 [Parcubacteria group bacterium]
MNTKAQAQRLPEYDEMIKAGMHFGRKKTVFHPNMKPFVYTSRENVYIIDLIKTADALTKAVEFLKESIKGGKTILFVGTTRQSFDLAQSTAKKLNMPYVTHRWLGGTFTNFKVIMSRIKHLESLESEQASGGFEKYTKKEKLLKEREIAGLKEKYEGLKGLTKLPDVIFVTSLKENALPIKEAITKNIKTVGIVNTDSDPKSLDYPIPANDTSRKSVELILEALEENLVSIEVEKAEVKKE